jgi:cytidyltransferase-like protein
MSKRTVYVSGAFDDLRSAQIRFLDEASRLGEVTVLLSDDQCIQHATSAAPKFPLAERKYTVGAIRYVSNVSSTSGDRNPHSIPAEVPAGAIVAAIESQITPEQRSAAVVRGIQLVTIADDRLREIPAAPRCPSSPRGDRPKVVVTGCFDWLHSGHVRFFEEIAEFGDLYVVVGHDANIRLLKGEGHPLFPEAERVYMVGAFRHVTCAVVSSGQGWLDGEPEFALIQPDIYAVNEDGDKPEKRRFCEERGIEYRVLKRLPKPGLPRRASTDLRGF